MLKNLNIENFWEIIFNNIILHYETPPFAKNLLYYLLEWLNNLLKLLLLTSRFCTLTLLGLQQTTFHVSGLPLRIFFFFIASKHNVASNSQQIQPFEYQQFKRIYTHCHCSVKYPVNIIVTRFQKYVHGVLYNIHQSAATCNDNWIT
jgi:hypothetical protein